MKHLSVKLNAPWFGGKHLKLLSLVGTLFITLIVSGSSCGGELPEPPELSGDTTPPSVVSITPAHGAVGIRKDSNIVITFSEAMDKTRTEQAFQSTDIPGFSLSWNEDATVLTVDPSNDLVYSSNGNSYSFSLNAGATDLAGNVLQSAPVGSSFVMLVLNQATLYSVASEDGSLRDTDGAINPNADCAGEKICVGDSGINGPLDNSSYRGFLSFDLSSLPETLIGIEEAQLSIMQTETDGSPYTDLGNLLWDHVFYDVLDATDFDIPVLTVSGQLLSADATNWLKTTEVTSAVQADWENRAARGNRSQYRLRFTDKTDNDGDTDVAIFISGEGGHEPKLVINYLTVGNSGGDLQ